MFDRWMRFAPLTGIVFVGLFIATFAVGGSTPGVHATGLKVISYYKAHHSGQKASDYLGVLGVVFLLFFAAALRTYLRRVEAARALAPLGFGGAIVLGMSGATFSALSWALVDARNTLDPSAAQALNVLSNDFFWPFAVGVAVFGMGYGLAIARSGALRLHYEDLDEAGAHALSAYTAFRMFSGVAGASRGTGSGDGLVEPMAS